MVISSDRHPTTDSTRRSTVKLSSVVKGLEILYPYFNNPDAYDHIGVDVQGPTDVIFVHPERPLKPEDAARMEQLGWTSYQTGRGQTSWVIRG
jgi:hypothetical protein